MSSTDLASIPALVSFNNSVMTSSVPMVARTGLFAAKYSKTFPE